MQPNKPFRAGKYLIVGQSHCLTRFMPPGVYQRAATGTVAGSVALSWLVESRERCLGGNFAVTASVRVTDHRCRDTSSRPLRLQIHPLPEVRLSRANRPTSPWCRRFRGAVSSPARRGCVVGRRRALSGECGARPCRREGQARASRGSNAGYGSLRMPDTAVMKPGTASWSRRWRASPMPSWITVRRRPSGLPARSCITAPMPK